MNTDLLNKANVLNNKIQYLKEKISKVDRLRQASKKSTSVCGSMYLVNTGYIEQESKVSFDNQDSIFILEYLLDKLTKTLDEYKKEFEEL